MNRLVVTLMIAVLTIAASPVFAGKERQAADNAAKRAEIDKVAQQALDDVLAKSGNAKALFEKAHGWAVFDTMRITFIFTGGGGKGVAVDKTNGKRTYMKMGTGGLALGIGAQKYQVVLLFETPQVFNRFIEKGWKAETGATAAAGTAGAGAGAGTTFINGIAVYQITEAGLMASADISGTKSILDKDLNMR
jgi:lipid-binding SYLF domain-containing protein